MHVPHLHSVYNGQHDGQDNGDPPLVDMDVELRVLTCTHCTVNNTTTNDDDDDNEEEEEEEEDDMEEDSHDNDNKKDQHAENNVIEVC